MGEYLVLSRDDLFWLKILISFFPAVPFGHIVSVGATLETAGDGLGFGSLGREYGYPGYSVGLAYLFVVLDGVLYILLAIYLDKVGLVVAFGLIFFGGGGCCFVSLLRSRDAIH